MKRIDLSGLVVGNWTVGKTYISRKRKNSKLKRVFWECKCSCGKTKFVDSNALSTGRTKSCGCLKSDKMKKQFRTGTRNITGKYWGHVLRGAKSRDLEFSISIDYAQKLLELQEFKCSLSGKELIMSIENSFKLAGSDWINTGSLDRIDSSKGYIEGNVQWVHKLINKMKNDIPEEIFIDYCSLIHNNCYNRSMNNSNNQKEDIKIAATPISGNEKIRILGVPANQGGCS